jgi:guanylate kinase
MTMTATTSTPTPAPAPLAATALRRRGMMVVLASPPGGGKTTVSRAIMQRDPQTTVSVSATTRAMRPGEVDGVHYYFMDKPAFENLIDKGDMLEHALVYNNYLYGTPRGPVEQALQDGRDVLFDIDWQGNRSLARHAPSDVVSIFLLPPSWQALADRLHNRAQDSEEEITRRLSKARDEIDHYTEFEYVVVNTDLEETIARVRDIIAAERVKRGRQIDLPAFVETLAPGKS